MKTHVDEPISWIKKLDKKEQSTQLHDAWIDLIQRIEKGSFLEQELMECLMKWYGKIKFIHFSQKNLNWITLLHISAFCGVKSLLEFIVSFNDNPNPPMGNGATPIDSAVFVGKFGGTPIYVASRYGHTDIVEFLASKVNNPNESNNVGETPIFIASRNGHIEIVKFLASKVASPNAPTYYGWTPIQVATLSGHTEIVKYLASKVEDPNAPTPAGETLIQLARRIGWCTDIVEFLSSI